MARVLVIDDESGVRASIEQILNYAGHEALLAADGRQGALLCRTGPPDLAIIDIFMPEQDGIETIAAFRREFPNVAIIAISGGHIASDSMLSTARQLGAERILAKPFSVAEFLSAVEEVLQGRSR